MDDLLTRRFDRPDEVVEFEKGRFELVRIGVMTIGRATYEPGWRWSAHVGRATGAPSCVVDHVGCVLSGRAMVRMDDGRELELRAGALRRYDSSRAATSLRPTGRRKRDGAATR